jgi:geranylgeranyl pyrophosphate synthase
MSPSPTEPLSLEAFRTVFNPVLASFMTTQTAAAAELDPLYGDLLQEMTRLLARGGKRLRPYLTYLGYLGYGGRNIPGIMQLAVSQELYHNAWLIHDDIIDHDLTRYGGPNLSAAYRTKFQQAHIAGGEHLADAMALLAGNVGMSLGLHAIFSAPFPTGRTHIAARRLQDTNFTLTGGELLDVLMPTLPLADITPERLLRVYQLKTAVYSFETPLCIGSHMADANVAQTQALSAFAIPLGIAFQLADDLLGIFGNETSLGKSVLSDLREGKRTVLFTYGLQLADAADRQTLKATLGDPNASYDQLTTIRRILEANGARAKTEALARSKVAQAQAALAHLNLEPKTEAALRRLADYVIERHL